MVTTVVAHYPWYVCMYARLQWCYDVQYFLALISILLQCFRRTYDLVYIYHFNVPENKMEQILVEIDFERWAQD